MPDRLNKDDPWIKEINRLLKAANAGDMNAGNELFELVYWYLHEMAKIQLAGDQIRYALRATSLVIEAYKKIRPSSKVKHTDHDAFLNVAAHAMWEVRIDRARKVKAEIKKLKKEAERRANQRGESPAKKHEDPKELTRLRAALEELRKMNQRAAEVVTLRFLLGLTVKQTAKVLGVSDRTVESDWKTSRAWLHRKIGGSDSSIITQ